jgi:hypothetical protein
MIAMYPGRRFQLWEYRVSHGSLLIRSPAGPEIDTTLDVVFAGVEFLSVPRFLPDLEVHHGTADDVTLVTRLASESMESQNVYALLSQGRRYLVLAAGCRVGEWAGGIFESPFL